MRAGGFYLSALSRLILVSRAFMSGNPSLQPIALTLLVAAHGVRSCFLMHLDVARNAERNQVVGVEASGFHLCLALTLLHRIPMVYIDSGHHLSFGLAHFAEWILRQLPHAQLLPSLRVQQLLVVLVSAHGLPFFCEGTGLMRLQPVHALIRMWNRLGRFCVYEWLIRWYHGSSSFPS